MKMRYVCPSCGMDMEYIKTQEFLGLSLWSEWLCAKCGKTEIVTAGEKENDERSDGKS